MYRWLALASLAFAGPALCAEKPFAAEADVLAITMDDQTQALKIKAIKRAVTITEAVKVLTTYRVVTREQYLVYAHTLGVACGSVRVKGTGTCLWAIEPGYAAVVTQPQGGKVYLLRPDLKVTPPSKG